MSLVVTRVFYNGDQTLRIAPDKVMRAWTNTGNRQFPEKILFPKSEKEVHMGGFWLKALIAMIIGRALWPGSSNGETGEQSTQDYDRWYDEGYQNGHDEGFHEHDDPDFFDDDFFE